MGLDISAYSELKRIGKHDIPAEFMDDPYDYCYEQDHHRPYENDDFPAHFAGLEEVCYVETPETETHSFRAGSYGGYSHWREVLAHCFLDVQAPLSYEAVGEERSAYWDRIHDLRDQDLPFYEQINFSDCEGSVGPAVCEKLYHDFTAGAQVFEAFVTQRYHGAWDRDYFLEKYKDWTKAYDLGRRNGYVDFH